MSLSEVLGPTLQFQREGDSLIAKILDSQLRDAQVVNRLREEGLAELDAKQAKSVVLDFEQVTFVGSVAFMAFLAIRRAPGVERVRLCNLDPKIKAVFEVCKLIPTPNREDAPFEVVHVPEAEIGAPPT
jgi:anti-anti-sigma regulatory factor